MKGMEGKGSHQQGISMLKVYHFVPLKVTTCLYLSPSNKALGLTMLIKIPNTKYSLRKLLPKSNKSQPKASQRYQLRDKLSLGYGTGVWTADEVKFPCVGQLESECSPEMQ